MSMEFRNLAGNTVMIDLGAEGQLAFALPDPAAEPGLGQVEEVRLLRKQIEALVGSSGDPAEAALSICVLLDEHLGLAEEGFFDDDDAVQDAILAARAADE